MTTRYELKLRRPDGSTFFHVWTADDPETAGRNCLDAIGWREPGAKVIGWRDADRFGVFVWGGAPIID
jgi:hypothetical protein